jgi:hypothetical protein
MFQVPDQVDPAVMGAADAQTDGHFAIAVSFPNLLFKKWQIC